MKVYKFIFKFIQLFCRLIKNELEKHLLKNAFNEWLPNEILSRSKDDFNGAFKKIKFFREIAEKIIFEKKFSDYIKLFPWHNSQTKEEFLYKAVYEGCFDNLVKIKNNRLFFNFKINKKFNSI